MKHVSKHSCSKQKHRSSFGNKLLGNGLGAEVVAQAVGCSASYITQLLSDDDFAQEVAERRVKNLSANTARDRKIDDIEDSILQKLGNAVDMNMIYKPNELLRAFQVINAAKRRGTTVNDGGQITKNTIINLNLPARSLQQFTITSEGEVVEAGGQTLTTAII